MQRRVPLRVGSTGLVLLAALCTSGAFSPVSLLGDGGPPLTAGEGRSGLTVPSVTAGAPYVVGMLSLCLTRAGEVTVVAVDAAQATGGLRVTDFAVGDSPAHVGGDSFVGSARGSLRDLSRGVGDAADVAQVRGLRTGGPQRFAVPCRPDRTGQLVVEVTRPTEATGSMQGVTVTYEVPGEAGTRTVVIGLAVTLCGPDDMDGIFCATHRQEP